MVELVLTFTLIGILTAMMIPKIGRTMQATRVNRTSAIVAADLEQAFTLAGRFRRRCGSPAPVTPANTPLPIAPVEPFACAGL